MNKPLIVISCALVLWLAVPVAAHHSMAGFDRKNPVTLVGAVKEFSWQNPHCWIALEVPGKDGKVVTWNVEMTAPGYLARAGWKKTSVKTGDKVTIVAAPLLTGEPGALFMSITLADGQTLSERGAPTAGREK
ncbi:MAG TPA: DUF6152 family protein [Bryobacteraceae bacterium]|jgi:hypothetical protein